MSNRQNLNVSATRRSARVIFLGMHFICLQSILTNRKLRSHLAKWVRQDFKISTLPSAASFTAMRFLPQRSNASASLSSSRAHRLSNCGCPWNWPMCVLHFLMIYIINWLGGLHGWLAPCGRFLNVLNIHGAILSLPGANLGLWSGPLLHCTVALQG